MRLILGDAFEESVLRFLVYFALFFVIFLVALPLKNYFRKQKLKKHPGASALRAIKQDIRALLQNDCDYKTILSELKSKYSYPKFMLEGFIIDVENEEKTVLENPKEIVRPNFRIRYPINWRIKQLDQDFDKEKYFTIEGSCSGIVIFGFVGDALQEFPSLKEINYTFSRQYQNFKIGASITGWGGFTGTGNLFTATVLNNQLSGKVFRYNGAADGFFMFLAAMDDDYDNVKDGFKMIEESFEKL